MRLLFTTLAACLVAAPAVGAPSPFPSGDATLDQTIQKENASWQTAMTKTGDAAAIAAIYEDDAVFVGVDGTATRGKAQIEALMRERFVKRGLAQVARVAPDHVVLKGTLAVEIGTGEIRYAGKDGKPLASVGGYLTVWRRQGDGSWRVHRNLVLP